MSSTRKSGSNSGRFQKGENGGGRGPKPGAPNAGRPPDKWRQALRQIADRDKVLEHIRLTLNAGIDEEGNFWKALDYVTNHGYGKAPQVVEDVDGNTYRPWVLLMPTKDPL